MTGIQGNNVGGTDTADIIKIGLCRVRTGDLVSVSDM